MVTAVGKSLGGPQKPAEKGGGCRRHRQDAEESRVPSRIAAPCGRRSDLGGNPSGRGSRSPIESNEPPQPATSPRPRLVTRVDGNNLRKSPPVSVRSSSLPSVRPWPKLSRPPRAARRPHTSRLEAAASRTDASSLTASVQGPLARHPAVGLRGFGCTIPRWVGK